MMFLGWYIEPQRAVDSTSNQRNRSGRRSVAVFRVTSMETSTTSDELEYDLEELDILSAHTAIQWEGIEEVPCAYHKFYGVDCPGDCTAGNVSSLDTDESTILQPAKQENFQTDKRELQANASFSSFRTADSYNTQSFISVGEMRARLGPGPEDEPAIRERPQVHFKSFYQQPELNELNEYGDQPDNGKEIVFDKPSQYQAEDMRDYTVCHTHPYWLKVQSLSIEESHDVTGAKSVYFIK
uniref:Testis expressed 26 n=1 Tax=Bursaphelenchus xylophilus TaxID=6326 RepID=A0A1I7RMR5_BURXY